MIKKGLSLVIPAHNAAHVIEQSVREYYNLFHQSFEPFEIIVVCNACSDNTAVIAGQLAKNFPLDVLDIPQRGKGNALIKGFVKAKYGIMGFLDVDNPFEPARILEMARSVQRNYCDVAIATKYLQGAMKGKRGIRDSNMRRLVALGGQAFAWLLFGLKFRDTQAGAKFFSHTVWESIDKHFICIGFDFDIEFLYKVMKKDFTVAEFYTPLFKYERFSTVRLKYVAGMIYRLVKFRFYTHEKNTSHF